MQKFIRKNNTYDEKHDHKNVCIIVSMNFEWFLELVVGYLVAFYVNICVS